MEQIYQKISPPGDPIPINVDPYPALDDCPKDAELREVMKLLRYGRTREASKMRAVDIQQ